MMNMPMPIQQQPAPFQNASLYVGDLHPDVTEGLLFGLFSRVGPVVSIRVCRDGATRRSLGYAYVNFSDMKDAERALDTMNFTEILNKPCRIMWSQRDPTLRKSGVGNIIVKNLEKEIDNKYLYDLFSPFGNILSCKVITDDAGASRGFGYVHFETAEGAQNSIAKLDGADINGQVLGVALYQRKSERTAVVEWTNLYVKQFPLTWSDEQFTGIVSVYGEIKSLSVTRDAEGKSKGVAFIDFASHACADAALKELNGLVVKDETGAEFTLYASQAQKKQDRVRELRKQNDLVKQEKINKLQGMNLYVKNFDEDITDDQLREAFAPFGTITSARVMKDDANGVSKGFGFVCYSSAEEATRAVAEMNNRNLNTKPITVTLHQRKDIRQQQLAQSHSARLVNQGGRGQFGNMQFGGPGFMNGRGAGMRGGPMGYPMNNQNNFRPNPMGAGPQGVQQGNGPRGNFMAGGRGGRGNMMGPQGNGRGGRGPMMMGPGGAPMMMGNRGPQMMGMPNVKFNGQARNQPQMPPHPNMMMHPNMMQMHQMEMQHQQMRQQQFMSGEINEKMLADADPQMQKNMIGERLYPKIAALQPNDAPKITGMLLEMENSELLHLLESPDALASKVDEAMSVLQKHNAA